MLGLCSQWYNKESGGMVNYKTSAIDPNVPAKVLSVNVTSAVAVKEWQHDDGQGDPWWTGSSNRKRIDGKSK